MKFYRAMMYAVFVVCLLAGCSASSPEREPLRVGILVAGDARLEKAEGMKQGLRDLGMQEKEVIYKIYNAKNDIQELARQAQKLVGENVDVVVGTGVAEGMALAQEMKSATRKPVVLIGVASPHASEIQALCQRKGISVAGVENGHIALTPKRMELLRLAFPHRDQMVVLYDPNVKASEWALVLAKETADQQGYAIDTMPVGEDADIKRLYERSFTKRESILILPSHYIEAQTAAIQQLSLQRKVPVMGLNEAQVKAGYTLSYGVSYEHQGYQAAKLLLRMVGEEPRVGIPFEMPDIVALKINFATVDKIGESVSKIGMSYGDDVFTGGE